MYSCYYLALSSIYKKVAPTITRIITFLLGYYQHHSAKHITRVYENYY